MASSHIRYDVACKRGHRRKEQLSRIKYVFNPMCVAFRCIYNAKSASNDVSSACCYIFAKLLFSILCIFDSVGAWAHTNTLYLISHFHWDRQCTHCVMYCISTIVKYINWNVCQATKEKTGLLTYSQWKWHREKENESFINVMRLRLFMRWCCYCCYCCCCCRRCRCYSGFCYCWCWSVISIG